MNILLKKTVLFFFIGVAFSCVKKKDFFEENSQVGFVSKQDTVFISVNDSNLIIIELPLRIFGKAPDESSYISYSIQFIEKENSKSKFLITDNQALKAGDYSPVLSVSFDASILTEGEFQSISIKLEPSDLDVASNFSETVLTLHKPSFIDLFVGKFLCSESLYSYKYSVDITKNELSDNQILIDNFWNFSADNQIVNAEIIKESQKIVLPLQEFTDKEGNNFLLSGEGAVSVDSQLWLDYIFVDSQTDTLIEQGSMHFIKQN